MTGADHDRSLNDFCQTATTGVSSCATRQGRRCHSATTVQPCYAYSVFSHLSEAIHLAWLKELRRIVCPGGAVALASATALHRVLPKDRESVSGSAADPARVPTPTTSSRAMTPVTTPISLRSGPARRLVGRACIPRPTSSGFGGSCSRCESSSSDEPSPARRPADRPGLRLAGACRRDAPVRLLPAEPGRGRDRAVELIRASATAPQRAEHLERDLAIKNLGGGWSGGTPRFARHLAVLLQPLRLPSRRRAACGSGVDEAGGGIVARESCASGGSRRRPRPPATRDAIFARSVEHARVTSGRGESLRRIAGPIANAARTPTIE